MQEVYTASDPLNANLVKTHLESHGIEAMVQDERTFSLRGDIPVKYPSVWVSDEDFERAKAVVLEFTAQARNPEAVQEAWTCPTCGETHAAQYTECWRCVAKEQQPSDENGTPPENPSLLSPRTVRTAIAVAALLAVLIVFRSIQSKRHSDALAHLRSAMKLLDASKTDEAIREYDQAIQTESGYAAAYYARGLAFLKKKDTPRALADFDEAIRLDPKASAYRGRARARIQAQEWREAESDCTAAIGKDPKYFEAYLTRGFARDRLNDVDGALQDYDYVIQHGDKMIAFDALLHRSDLLVWRGRPHEALADLNRAAEMITPTPQLLIRRARIWTEFGHRKEAFRDIEQASQLAPAMASRTEVVRAWTQLHFGLNAEALETAQRMLSNGMKDEEAYFLNGLALKRMGRTAEALQAFQQVVAVASKDTYLGYCGYAAAQLGQFEQALAYCERERHDRPWQAVAEFWTGCVLAERAKSHPDDATGRSARATDIELGLKHLTAAMEKGMKHDVGILSYPELGLLREHPRFEELQIQQFEARAKTK